MIRKELAQLIQDMDNENYPDDTAGLSEPIQSIGWYAYRKAEGWEEPSDFKPLLNYLDEVALDDQSRDNVYTILLSLVANADGLELTEVFSRLKKETDTDLIENVLSRVYMNNTYPELNPLPIKNSDDIDFLLQLSYSDNYFFRSKVWLVLRFATSSSKKIESRLIEGMQKHDDVDELEGIVEVVQTQGSLDSIAALKALMLQYQNKDVLTMVVKAIDVINGPKEVDYLIEQLEVHRNGNVKSTICDCLARLNDEKAIDPLMNRVKKILSKKRNTSWGYPEGQLPELCEILNFLQHHRLKEEEKINKLLKWIKEKKMDFLDEQESEWVVNNLKL